jgi:AraC family ethanolamine operon transcriptional activator
MCEIMNTPTVAQHQFECFEVLASSLASYDLDVKQFDCGSFFAFMQQMQCGHVFINRFTITRRIEVNGNPPPGVWTFGVPTANCQPFIWRGQHSDADTIQIYKPPTELAMMTNPEFEAIDVSISENDFNALNHRWGLPDLAEIIGAREMAICDPAVMYRLRKTLQYICQVVDSDPEALKQNANLQNLVGHEVPYLLAQTLMSSDAPVCKAAPDKRSRALKTAIEYIRTTTDEATSVNSFCRQTGINERTLQRAFLDTYGITPKSYMQAFRLNRAYKALLKSNPDSTSITEVANELGYWHMSQFAATYRRQFGELPSQTLRTN